MARQPGCHACELDDDQSRAPALNGCRKLFGELYSEVRLNCIKIILRLFQPEPGRLAVDFDRCDLLSPLEGLGDCVEPGICQRSSLVEKLV